MSSSRKTIYIQPVALKTLMKPLPDMVWPGGQKFQGRTKIFNTVAENFYPGIIKFSGGQGFLDCTAAVTTNVPVLLQLVINELE